MFGIINGRLNLENHSNVWLLLMTSKPCKVNAYLGIWWMSNRNLQSLQQKVCSFFAASFQHSQRIVKRDFTKAKKTTHAFITLLQDKAV